MADTKISALTADASPTLDDLLVSVNDPAGTPANRKVTADALRKLFAANDLVFYPRDNEPPTSNYATLDTRNSHPVLDFDTTTGESAIFTGILPRSYNGGGLTVEVAYSMTSATTGTCGWTFDLERIGDSQLDIDGDSFTGSPTTITAVTVPGTTGHVDVVSANVANGAAMDSIAAGEMFRIKITRDVANDDAAGDAELHWVRIREQ
jgi:hypothetical protein